MVHSPFALGTIRTKVTSPECQATACASTPLDAAAAVGPPAAGSGAKIVPTRTHGIHDAHEQPLGSTDGYEGTRASNLHRAKKTGTV